MTKTKASALKLGDSFTLNSRKNAKVYTINTREGCCELLTGEHYAGYLLIVMDDCRQMTIHPETKVWML